MVPSGGNLVVPKMLRFLIFLFWLDEYRDFTRQDGAADGTCENTAMLQKLQLKTTPVKAGHTGQCR